MVTIRSITELIITIIQRIGVKIIKYTFLLTYKELFGRPTDQIEIINYIKSLNYHQVFLVASRLNALLFERYLDNEKAKETYSRLQLEYAKKLNTKDKNFISSLFYSHIILSPQTLLQLNKYLLAYGINGSLQDLDQNAFEYVWQVFDLAIMINDHLTSLNEVQNNRTAASY